MVPDPSPPCRTAGFQSFLHSTLTRGHWQIHALIVNRNLAHWQNNQEAEAPQCSQPSLLSKQKHPSFHPAVHWLQLTHLTWRLHIPFPDINEPQSPFHTVHFWTEPWPYSRGGNSRLSSLLAAKLWISTVSQRLPYTAQKNTALTKSHVLDKTPW